MAIDLQEGRGFRQRYGGREGREPPPRRRELEEERYWQRSRRVSPSRRSRSRPRAASPPRRRRDYDDRGRERGGQDRRPPGRDEDPRDGSRGRRRASRSHASGSRRQGSVPSPCAAERSGRSRAKEKTEDAPSAAATDAPALSTNKEAEVKKEPEVQKLAISARDGFSVGQRVKARYLSGSFYTATIEGFLADGQVLLQWADGDANDRKKKSEELVPCDASGHPLGSEAEAAARREAKEAKEAEAPKPQAPPAPTPPTEAELTPAERAQAERIREFQRLRQGGEPKVAPEAAPTAAENESRPSGERIAQDPPAPRAPELPLAERQKLEERLQVLRVQYLRLHEQISADTESTEKEMQELVRSGASDKDLMTFRSERLSLQSGQRLAALQISKQITEVEQKLNPDRGLRSDLDRINGDKQKEPASSPSHSPQPSLQELWGSG
ncbi:Lonrf3 [Symbiodinium natans]|uniref:Lonrf3 protein n=1 Tax=Symbiodinium natans TaxID=878477 RepID=A0A812KAA4_9DINO|nr:Lonrf3 [Symbiodinium natans]